MLGSIILEPAGRGPCDVESIRAHFLAHPAVIERARSADTLQLIAGEEAQGFARRPRLKSEKHSLMGGVVSVQRELVHLVIAEAPEEEVLVMRDVAQWPIDNHRSKISGLVVGDDWAEGCAGSVDPMVGPELPRPA